MNVMSDAPTPNGSEPSPASPDVPGYVPAEQPRPLRTEPRSWLLHVLVDGLVGFCATALILAFFGIPLWVMILVGWTIGFVAAPFTRRLEAAQLAERRREAS